jgi:drug/metabolite transporter (DMT)-like permease
MPSPPASSPAIRAVHPNRGDYLLLVALGLTWGASFLLIKLAVATIPPLTVVAGRVVIGVAILMAIARLRGVALPTDRATWAKLAAMGALGTVLPFTLITWGETRIDSGLAAILMAFVPISAIVMAHLFQPDEPLTTGKIAGVALGLVGLVVLVGPSALAGLGRELVAQVAVLIAALCYAANTVVARRLGGLSADMVSIGMMASAAVIAVPAALVVDRPWTLDPSALSLLAVLLLGVVSTALGYVLLFAMVARAGAGFAAFNNFLVPPVGVLWGVTLLGEEPGPHALLALAIVLGGLIAPRLWTRPIGRRAG